MSVHWPTLLFQALNFLVLFALLTRLMFRPLLRHMASRKAKIAGAFEAIEADQKQLEIDRAHVAEAESHLAQRTAEAAAEGRRQAELERTTILQHARKEAEEERARGLARVERERARARDELVGSVAPLVSRATARLLEQIGPEIRLHEAACARLAEQLTELEPRPGRVEVESATGEITPELELATSRLDPESTGRQVRHAPELIAGARVRLGHRVLDGSVRAQIGRVLEGVA